MIKIDILKFKNFLIGEFHWAIICWSNTETYLCSVDRIDRVGINESNEYVI